MKACFGLNAKRGGLLGLLLFIALAGWLITSSSGLQWLAGMVSRHSILSLQGVNGTLLGPVSIETLEIGATRLRITARDVKLDWRPAALLKGRLELAELTAQEVEMLSLPSPYPENLCLALPLSLHRLTIGTLRLLSEAGTAFAANALSLALESDGCNHTLSGLRADSVYGQLSAKGQLDGNRPFALSAEAELYGSYLNGQAAHILTQLSGNLAQLSIDAQGSGAGLDGKAALQLAPYQAFPLTRLSLQAKGLDPQAFNPAAPKARLTLAADLHIQLNDRLEGTVSVQNLSAAPLDRGGLPLQEARANVSVSAEALQFDNLSLAVAGGGNISGRLAWQRKAVTGKAQLKVSGLDPAALDGRLRAAKLNGNLELGGDGALQRGTLALSDGALHLDALLETSGHSLSLQSVRLSRGRATLTGQGKLQLDGRQDCNFNGKLQHFDLSAFLQAGRSDLNATLELQGMLKPQATGKLSFHIDSSRLAEQPASGSGWIELSGPNRAKIDALLHLGDNRLSAKGGFGAATDLLQLELVAPALEQLGYGGALEAHGSLSGDLAQLSLELEGRKLVLPGDTQLASLKGSLSLNKDALQLNLAASGYKGKDRAGLQSLQLEMLGSRNQHRLNAKALLENGSKLLLDAKGGFGDATEGWKNPLWRGELTGLSGTGALPFTLQAPSRLSFSLDQVLLDAAEFALAGGKLQIKKVAWTPQHWSSSGSFTGIGLRAASEAQPGYIAEPDQQALRLYGEWNIDSSAQSDLRLARESGDWVIPGDPAIPLGLQNAQFSAHANSERLTAELAATGDRLGNWHAQLAVPLLQGAVPAHAPLDGALHIDIADLSFIGPALSSNLNSSGRLRLDADIKGSLEAPRLLGQASGTELSLAFLDQGVRLQQGLLEARFDQQSVHIDNLSFTAPYVAAPKDRLLAGVNLAHEPGKLSASGALKLDGSDIDLKISASRFPLVQRSDRWIIASGSGQASLNKNVLVLGGKISADAGLINQPVSDKPQLSEDILILGKKAASRKGPNLSIEATLELGEHFFLRASGLEARLAGQLNMRETPGQPLRVTGSIAAKEARFEAYGQHLTVERGIVNFQGPLYDPGLNILAQRKGLSVEAGVQVTGTALRPTVRLVSTPEVPDSEKISWIVQGRAPDSSGSDTTLLLAAAGSILGGGSGGLTGQLKQSLGVDELSVRQVESSAAAIGQTSADNPLSSQIVTVGKRLSSRAFISYERGVAAVSGMTKLSYTLTPRVNIVTQAGIDNAIDVFYTFSFD